MTRKTTSAASLSEIGLLIAIALIAAVAFSPVGSNLSIFGIDLVAWLLYVIMVFGPVVALILALRSRED